MNSVAPPSLKPPLVQTLHQVEHWRHALRIAIFFLLYLLAAAGALFLIAQGKTPWRWLAVLPCYLLAGASLHGISLFAHEAVHGSLARNAFLNRLCGALCAIPVLQNCSAYRVLHLRHHRHLGEDGDPDHYANYTRWTWMIFIMNWLRLLVGYPVYITAIPILGFKHGNTRDRLGIIAELLLTVLAAAALLYFLPAVWLLHGWLIPMLFINTMVNIRGMSQHTLLEHSNDEIRGTRTILTVPLVRFFMCNENYHLEHHLYPGVPWHQLPKLHAALGSDLRDHGAPYISSYSAFVLEFLHRSIERSPLSHKNSSS